MMKCERIAFGPISFNQYLKDNDLPIEIKTASYISIDCLSRLDKQFRDNNIMVIRLGSPQGDRNTFFALIKSVNSIDSDYFIIDSDLFSSASPELFIPTASYNQLFPFSILLRFTETSIVNFCIASGFISHALRLDRDELPSVLVTGQSTYSFKVKPHKELPIVWEHNNGQVEIDALISARRNDRNTLFIIEAKAGDRLDSLAKHKFMYPFLTLQKYVSQEMEIAPVYISYVRQSDSIKLYFAEFQTEEVELPSISRLQVTKTSQYLIKNNFSSRFNVQNEEIK